MRQDAREIEAEAASWVARMDAGAWSSADEKELQRWLSGHPRRSGALLQAQAAWATLDAAGPLLPAVDPIEVARTVAPSGTIDRRRALVVGGTALAASLVGGGVLFHRGMRYRTDIGEIRRVPLSDGSTAAINTASLLAVRFEKRQRSIDLERGEAWFHVAHDPTRPFVVSAGPVRVQAVGTAFAVRLRDDGTEVSVTEGVVQVWTMDPEGNSIDRRTQIRISAGGRAVFAADMLVDAGQGREVAIDRALAWREGKIDLAGATLGEAATEFNRYNRRRLVIADPAIAPERFDGTFSVDDVQGFALAVRRSLSVPIDLASTSEIRLGAPAPNA